MSDKVDGRTCTCGGANKWHGIHMRGCVLRTDRDVSVAESNDTRYGRYGVHVMCHAYGEIQRVMLTANDARAFAQAIRDAADKVGPQHARDDDRQVYARFAGMEE